MKPRNDVKKLAYEKKKDRENSMMGKVSDSARIVEDEILCT